MYKIAICDDCTADVRYLATLAEEWAQRKETPAAIREFPSAEAFLSHYDDSPDFDILLLDIEMTGQNGIELAKGYVRTMKPCRLSLSRASRISCPRAMRSQRCIIL